MSSTAANDYIWITKGGQCINYERPIVSHCVEARFCKSNSTHGLLKKMLCILKIFDKKFTPNTSGIFFFKKSMQIFSLTGSGLKFRVSPVTSGPPASMPILNAATP